MVRADDALDLLLPGCAEPTLLRARRVVHMLRLLCDDAHPARASSTGVDLDRARDELEIDDRRRLERALLDLLRHNLTAVAGPESFSWFGETGLAVQAAWRVLEEHRGERTWIAGVPEPDERALSVAARLFESLERLGVPECDLDPWRARILFFSNGDPANARAAEKFLRARLSACEVPSARRPLVAGVAECLLDRGAVREARAWLLEHGPLVEGDARLRHLLAWTRLCLDDAAGARNLLVGLSPWGGPLPAALAELREVRPEWLPCLAGRARAAGEPAGDSRERSMITDEVPIRDRSEIGASVLAVFAFRPGDGARPVFVDAAPALKPLVPAWLADRDGASTVAGEREHALVVAARAVVAHRTAGEPGLGGVLGGEATAALALAPVPDQDGEVAGWLHVECEHHLLPSRARLARLARAWRGEVLAHRAGEHEPEEGSRSRASEEEPDAADPACAEVFRELVRDLGIKTAQRRWWGFAVQGAEARLVATGGEGTGFSDSPSGRRRALSRALATGGAVLFEESDERLSIDERAGSGAVLPLRAGNAIRGLLAIESTRRRDFRDEDLDRYRALAGSAGLALRLAQFRGWHQQRFGFDVWFDAAREDFQVFAQHVLAAARTRSPVVLCGPAGSGKQILARWVHFESASAAGPLAVQGCATGAARGGIAELLASAEGGSLLLDDLEGLDPALQEELLRWLEAANGARPRDEAPARILATTRLALAQAVAAGKLRHDLAQRLDRLQLRVPALKERREDILPLVDCLARRFAAEEGLAAPEFSDEALALLWRQSWEGNVRELESFVYKLVLLRHRGPRSMSGPVEPSHVLDIAARFSFDVLKRLPSRHPQRSDLLAALRVTRKAGGKSNKTRAAAYLGWDPDTLVARMHEAGVGEETAGEGDVWKARAPDSIGPDSARPELGPA